MAFQPYTIERTKYPAGKITLPAVESFTEIEWMIIEGVTQAHKIEVKSDTTMHMLRKHSAFVLCKIIEAFGKKASFSFEEMPMEKFLSFYEKGNEMGMPTQFMNLLARHHDLYVGDLVLPND